MSTEMQSNSNMVSLTRFWGGDTRGLCIQVTSNKFPFPYISLTFHECKTAEDDVMMTWLGTVTDSEHDIILADLRAFGENKLKEDWE